MTNEETLNNLTKTLVQQLHFDWKDEKRLQCLVHNPRDQSRQILICKGEGWMAEKVSIREATKTNKIRDRNFLQIQKIKKSWTWNSWLKIDIKTDQLPIKQDAISETSKNKLHKHVGAITELIVAILEEDNKERFQEYQQNT